eukprot:NODE_10576_length_483_cov_37.213483_g10553_i0.p3 GENE.NODE_10576_length_483_cov_37.213483_g10553_i0~~NODE_10576_length_483_cov_37.213483_g10553_i0.p3  ORF type:complete len:147 (-),score=32.71 NODE_10576_length_483_cov_37.213483_g10553_i0:42-434(-)
MGGDMDAVLAGRGRGGRDGGRGGGMMGPGIKIDLVYWNHTEDDILAREELASLAENGGDVFRMTNVLTKPNNASYEPQGRVNEAQLQGRLPPPGEKTQIIICGPTGFNEACMRVLPVLGYTAHMCTVLEK